MPPPKWFYRRSNREPRFSSLLASLSPFSPSTHGGDLRDGWGWRAEKGHDKQTGAKIHPFFPPSLSSTRSPFLPLVIPFLPQLKKSVIQDKGDIVYFLSKQHEIFFINYYLFLKIIEPLWARIIIISSKAKSWALLLDHPVVHAR